MTVVANRPEVASSRSQLYRWHAARGAEFAELAGAVFVGRYGDNEKSAARHLGVCDLSLAPRFGVTGPGAGGWLETQRFDVPPRPNTSRRQSNGDLLSRLSDEEFLCLGLACLEGAADCAVCDGDMAAGPSRVVRLPRADSHCLFSVCGDATAEMFSKLCGVDLRPDRFADGSVAQTSVARVNAIVIRRDLGDAVNFLLLTATPAAEYLWECLIDAIAEFEGRPIGVAALMDIVAGI